MGRLSHGYPVIDVPQTPKHQQRERGRVYAQGHRTDYGTASPLLIVHEADGSWSFHGLGAPAVKLSQADTIAMVESILAQAQRDGAR